MSDLVIETDGVWPPRRIVSTLTSHLVEFRLSQGHSPLDAEPGDRLRGPHGEEFVRVPDGWWCSGSPLRCQAVAVAGAQRPEVDGPVCWLPAEDWTRPPIGDGFARANVDTLIERGH